MVVVYNKRMCDAWKDWCRLCAKEYIIIIKEGDEKCSLNSSISRYLSVDITSHDYPHSICEDCSNVVTDFDNFATKCRKIQLMFDSFVQNNQNQTNEYYKALRDDYLLQISSDEKKFVPPVAFATVQSKNGEISGETDINTKDVKLTRKRKRALNLENENSNILNLNKVSVKVEAHSDGDEDINYFFDVPLQSDSDEDYNIPLANVTDIKSKKIPKLKLKKPKISTKVKHKKKDLKKKNKRVPELLDVIGEKVYVKDEPLSDIEVVTEDNNISSEEKKSKKERKLNRLSFLKYDCYICGEDTKNWNALCIHFRDVHDARAKIMCCCGKFLASRVSIGRHSAKHGKAPNSFDCPKCMKRFPRESELSTHMISHLPKEEHPFVCCKCARRFTTQQLLRHHEKKHIPMEERLTHPCDICHSKFASKSSLMMHMKAVHERLKPFVCDQCGRAFTTKGILEEHQVRHSDARPHVCNICHKSFKTKQRLAIHSDTHNDTVYQCPHCPIKLNSRRTLRMHLFVHDEVCRYQCSFCDKAFKRAKDLKNHSNLHTGRRPYSCPWCSRTFANGSNCRAHKRRMHPNELRISDASAALVHKVPPSEEPENKQPVQSNNSSPKVIYTTVKRKPTTEPVVKTPNFSYRPDISEKDVKMDVKNNSGFKNVDVKDTKLEEKSPVHNSHDRSMSPLNLNKTSNRFIKTDKESSVTVILETPDATSNNTLNAFQNVSQNYNVILPNRNMEQSFNAGNFNKNNQLYPNFTSSLYNSASTTSQFPSTNSYGIHFSREEEN